MKSETPPPRKPASGRKLTIKSKPFWELEAERKAAREQTSPTLTASDTSEESTADDGSINNVVSHLVAKAIAAAVLAVEPGLVLMHHGLSDDETSEVVANQVQREEAPTGEVCTKETCGCGSDAPPPIAPLAWIDGLADELARARELEWLGRLSEDTFRVLRMKATEEIHTGEYNEHFVDGVYVCAACARPLYDATHKFKSGHGWPAFSDNLPDALSRHEKKKKVEITCAGCDGHVGHVFSSKRYPKPHHERHCVNSISLSFVPR